MTEIEQLRKELNELRERVAVLEKKPAPNINPLFDAIKRQAADREPRQNPFETPPHWYQDRDKYWLKQVNQFHLPYVVTC